ncbi:MAG TPA: condensation domain-containing protein, partial [Ktedonobacteraceae bacterium]|nr:condensation domain-containing protein [Ktedonobacteraceae bacterium]
MRYAGSHEASGPSSPEGPGDDVFVFPASFAQRRLWFLDQWEPGVYIIPLAVGMEGTLDVGAMEQALKDMIQRHEALRTTFRMEDNALVQVVASQIAFSMPLLELQHFPEDVRRVKLRRLVKEEFHRPFDLQRGPLIRAHMVKMQEDYHAFLLSMHHIVSDAWSMEIFFRELTNTYTAYVQGETLTLPRLELQYADYTIWQQQWLQGEVLEQHLAYWREQLQDAPLLQLPFARSRPGLQTFRAQTRIIVLSRVLSDALKALSRREGTTLFMLLLAAFKTLLYRYTRQERIVVGIPIAGRTESRLETVLGCFINTLALCTEVSGNPTFRELLKRVRDVTLGAYAHQDMPFEKLVEELQPERDLSRNPFTQVMFALQNVPKKQLHMAGLKLIPIKLDSETSMIASGESLRLGKAQMAKADNEPAMFDLDLTMWERGGELVGELKYNLDLFDDEMIEQFQTHFLRLLEAIVADPGQRINDLPLLTDHERWLQTVTWNEVEVPYELNEGYLERFRRQAALTPQAVALVCGTDALTYRELDRRSNALALHLRTRGIGPERLVAVLDQRGLPLAVALLAILKAGGAYLPLDPSQPLSRLRQMIRQSGCALVLIGTALAEHVEDALSEWPVEERPAWEVLNATEEAAEGPALPWQGERLAYVIYTSGSTGLPKGVMVEHRGMLNHLLAKVAALDLH